MLSNILIKDYLQVLISLYIGNYIFRIFIVYNFFFYINLYLYFKEKNINIFEIIILKF